MWAIILAVAGLFVLSGLTVFRGPVDAADTATLFPDGQGTYNEWTGTESDIDETGTPVCVSPGGGDGDENVSTSTNDRESVNINLSSILNGSTITSVTVEVAYRDGNSSGADGTFQTFARLNGTDTDSGVNLVASSSTCTSTTQVINVADTIKNDGTTLEIGVLKTATDGSEVWVGAIRAVVTYTPPVANPDLDPTQACGLDIALVFDRSGSIDGPKTTAMKNAAKEFTTALNGTPSRFAVIEFGTGASTVGGNDFVAGDVASGRIDNILADTTGQYTNWEAGLMTAHGIFVSGTSNPNLTILLTDGDPTNSSAGQTGDAGPPNFSEATYNKHTVPAVVAANNLKGTSRILAIGIGMGGAGSLARLSSITGSNVDVGITTSDVITTANFQTLAADLQAFAEATCGGTITVTKEIDNDGNLETSNEQPQDRSDWDFTANSVTQPTDASGQTMFDELEPGNYSVTETQKEGYKLIAADCYIGNEPIGGLDGDTVYGLEIGNNDIVTCTFINSPLPKLTLVKQVVGGEEPASSWTLTATPAEGDPLQGEGGFSSQYAQAGVTYDLGETGPTGYTASDWNCTPEQSETFNLDGSQLTMNYGADVTCTITNTIIGQISGTVYHDQNSNQTKQPEEPGLPGMTVWLLTHNSPWTLEAITTTNGMGEYLFGNLSVPGEYYVCQDVQDGWLQTQLNNAGLGGVDIGALPLGPVGAELDLILDTLIPQFCYTVELTLDLPNVNQRDFGSLPNVQGSSTTNDPGPEDGDPAVLGTSTLAESGTAIWLASLVSGLLMLGTISALALARYSNKKNNQL